MMLEGGFGYNRLEPREWDDAPSIDLDPGRRIGVRASVRRKRRGHRRGRRELGVGRRGRFDLGSERSRIDRVEHVERRSERERDVDERGWRRAVRALVAGLLRELATDSVSSQRHRMVRTDPYR